MQDEITPAETPLAKARLNLEQTVRLVSLLQNIEQRLNIYGKGLAHLQIKYDRADPVIYNQIRQELELETKNKMEMFIEALDDDDRPSQTIIINKQRSTRPNKREYITQIVTFIVIAVAAFVIALRETGLIK